LEKALNYPLNVHRGMHGAKKWGLSQYIEQEKQKAKDWSFEDN
jgi:hypothetical protein